MLGTVSDNGQGNSLLRLSVAAKIAAGVITALLVSAIIGNIAMYRAVAILETRQTVIEKSLGQHLDWEEEARRGVVSREEFSATIAPIQSALGRIEGKLDAIASRRHE